MSTAAGASEFDLAAHVLRANAAWTSEDVESSRTAVGTGTGQSSKALGGAREIVNAATNPDPSLAVIGLQKGIHNFLRVKPTGPRFEAIWRAMEPSARAHLLLAVSPYMPLERGVSVEAEGAATLMPEMNVRDLAHNPNGFLDLVASMADNDLIDIYQNDAEFVKPLLAARKMFPVPGSHAMFALIQGGKYPGEVYQIKAGGAVPASIKRFIQMGAAIEGPTWSLVIQRRHLIMQTIALVLDEFNSEVFNKSEHRVLSSSQQCLACGMSGSSRKLKFCSRCSLAPYCSRECQMRHWKEHKKACKATLKGKSSAGSASQAAPDDSRTESVLEEVD